MKLDFSECSKGRQQLRKCDLTQQCYSGKSLLLGGRKVNRNRKISMVAGRQQT